MRISWAKRTPDIFCSYFDVSLEGNFEGTEDILHVPRPGAVVAKLNPGVGRNLFGERVRAREQTSV